MKKLLTVLLALACLGSLQFCSSSKKSASTEPKKSEVPKLTFAANVLPLIQAKCSPCHISPDGKKKFLDTYDAASISIDDMIKRMQLNPGEKGFMPFKKTEKLPDSLIAVFVKWKADGLVAK